MDGEGEGTIGRQGARARSRWPSVGWLALGALVVATLLWELWEPLTAALGDLDGLRAWVASLGAWGPLAVIALGVLQVLVAPLPGYPLVIVSALLFGGFWGAIYANIGMMIAGALTAWLARRFGRPLVERFVEAAHLERAERLLASDSGWLWFFILLLPTGDLPYFVAGLSRIPFARYIVVLFLARFPFTFVVTYATARATTLPDNLLLATVGVIMLVALLLYSQQEQLNALLKRLLHRIAPAEPTADR